MAEQYTYAVARIHAKEMTLLNRQDLEQLLTASSYDEALRMLADKGFGDGENFSSSEELLSYETQKTWNTINELVDDMSVFDVFLYANDFHNLKSAVKSVITDTDTDTDKLFIKNGTIAPQVIYDSVKNREFGNLPQYMQNVAENALNVLLKTGDGQECDIIIDKASLEAIRNAGKKSKNAMIDGYAELTVALSDIKAAVRACRLNKSAEFLGRMLAECDTLDIKELIVAASKDIENVYEYLSLTKYSGAVEYLKISMSEFEKWCDNLVMEHIKEQKSNMFTIAPLAAYILARESEIKAVRIVLSGIQNSLDNAAVRERLRDLYV